MLKMADKVVLIAWRRGEQTASLGWEVRCTKKGLRIWRLMKVEGPPPPSPITHAIQRAGFKVTPVVEEVHPKHFDPRTGFEIECATPGSYHYIVKETP